MIKNILKLFVWGIYIAMLVVYLNAWISPSDCYWVSFIGLGYLPIILLFMLMIGLAYWLSKRLFFIGIGILLIGLKIHLGYFSVAVPNESTTNRSMKLLSYNVRLFNLYSNTDGTDKEKMFDFLKKQKADIYCFQEFYVQDPPTKFYTRDTLMSLLQTKYIHEHYSFIYVGRQYFGVTMMSKFPMIAKGDVSFEDDDHTLHNYCIYADIVPAQGDTIRVYNAHLQSIRISNIEFVESKKLTDMPTENNLVTIYRHLRKAFLRRQAQTDKIIKHIESSPYPVVVMGDFNDTPTSYTYLQFRRLLKDAFTENKTGVGATYAEKLPVGRIDYILHSDSLNAYDFHRYKLPFTDHYPVSCKINY